MKKQLLLTGLLAVLAASTLRAEGSRQLTPNRPGTPASLGSPLNTRAGFLLHDFNNIVTGQYQSLGFLKPSSWSAPGNRNFSDDYRLKVRLKPGEALYYGVHRLAVESTNPSSGQTRNYQNLVLTLNYQKSPNQVETVKSNQLARLTNSYRQAELATTQPGVIDNAAQALAGPAVPGTATATTGYDPLVYVNNTGATQDFWVEFAQAGENNMTTLQKASQYDFWDFTVRSNTSASGVEKKGRLFSKFWSFSTTGYSNLLSSTFNLYPLIESVKTPGRYYVKQVELGGLAPYAFYFVSNANGTSKTGTFANSRKSQISEKTYSEYPNFVNNPDPELWPSAPLPLFSRTLQPFCNPSTGRGAMAFTTLSEEAGSTSVLIDLNGDGILNGNDVLLEQTVAANEPATIYWNGLNAANQPVALGTQISTTFVSNGAPVNFPLFDAEGNIDGLQVQNVRPSQGGDVYYDRLYWDDRNLTSEDATKFPSTLPDPDQRNARLDGVDSEAGVHRWGATATTDAKYLAGDNFTVNTWTYGFISAPYKVNYIFNFDCDFDNDGIADTDDKDDDNDGIPDMVETAGIDPQTLSNNVLVYLDAAYRHNGLPWRDVNRDGINDLFDQDLDGVPNHFDADTDGDGILDALEANGYVLPAGLDGTTGRISGPVGRNGMPNSVENNDGNNPTSTLTSVMRDWDSDGIADRLDLDSDNDGILDNREVQTTSAYRAPSGSDTDKDGIDNSYDGTATALTTMANTDATTEPTPRLPDLLDPDTDGDGEPDWTEGFDDDHNGYAMNDLLARAVAFRNANAQNNALNGFYASNGNGAGWMNSNSQGKGLFLDPTSPHYHDTNQNGMADLFDPAFNGTPSSAPKRNASQSDADFRLFNVTAPLPVELVAFDVRKAGSNAVLTWTTAQEVNNARFEVERSADGLHFEQIGQVAGNGTSSGTHHYRFADAGAALSTGTRYYRLRQVDFDAKSAYSKVRTLSFGAASNALLAVLPNPTAADSRLDLTRLPQGQYAISVIAADGRTVLHLTADAGQVLPLTTSSLARGTYLVRVTGASTTQVVRLLKW